MIIYMDEHIPAAITVGLRVRSVAVLTVQEDGRRGASDEELLDRATELDAVIFTQDDDFLREATQRQRTGRRFAGVIYCHQNRCSVRQIIEDLELVATLGDPQEMANRVVLLYPGFRSAIENA